MPKTLITGLRFPGTIAFEDGRITSVGVDETSSADRVIDCPGDLATAGLINTHHHLWQWLTRGRFVDSDLFGWLSGLYPVWSKVTPDDVHLAATVGLSELALSGCTTTADHHYLVPSGQTEVFEAVIDAAETVGLRLHLGRGGMDLGQSRGGLPPDELVENVDQVLESIDHLVSRRRIPGRTEIVVAPNSLFTTSLNMYTACVDYARANNLLMHTHLAEDRAEEEFALANYGNRPLKALMSVEALVERSWVAHGILFDRDDIAILRELDIGVAHCPSSNARLAAGICPVSDLVRAGIAVGLGVDGAASNEVGGLFPEIRQALYSARLRTGNPSDLTPADALALATEHGARCLGREDIGRLQPGTPADIVVWPGDDIRDIDDPVSALVLARDRKARHVFVGGEMIVEAGQMTACEMGPLRNRLAKRSEKLYE